MTYLLFKEMADSYSTPQSALILKQYKSTNACLLHMGRDFSPLSWRKDRHANHIILQILIISLQFLEVLAMIILMHTEQEIKSILKYT